MSQWGCATLLLALLVLGCPVIGCGQDAQIVDEVELPKGTLTAGQLMALFNNKTVHSITVVAGRESVSYYAPSGEIRQKRQGITRYGRWRVIDNHRICLQIENLPEKCRIVVLEQGVHNKYIVRKNGQHQHSVTYTKFQQGNPEGL